MNAKKILIVEDEAVVALDLKLQLQDLGYEVVGVVATADQALQTLAATPPDLVLMDVHLQGPMDGITAAQIIGQQHHLPLIFLTAHSDNNTVQRAAQAGAYGYLTKPYQINELRAGIEIALTKARMERQLREADRWFAQTLKCVADAVILTDLQARLRFLNPAAEALTGWSLSDALGLNVDDIVCLQRPADEAAAPNAPPLAPSHLVAEVLREGRPAPVAHALSLQPRSGPLRHVDQTAGPVNDDHGQRLGAVLVLRDAGPRMAQEALLRASEARFRNAFEFAPLGMALVSFGGEIIQANDALCNMLARPLDELKRCNQLDLTWPADRAHEAQRLHELAVLETTPTLPLAGVVQLEKRYLRPGGQAPLWALVSVSLIRGDSEASCYLYQVHDLTEQKRASEHLATLADERLRRQASELANDAKTEFLSRVSHEMRTPLNAVIGFAQLLQLPQETPSAASVRLYADHIHGAGKHLLALVNDLLDIHRVSQGGLNLVCSVLPLAQVLSEALLLIQAQAVEHGVGLDNQGAEELQVVADAQRLRQVLVNVVSNAIKYNRPGGEVRLRSQRLPESRVSIEVQDQGVGMSPAQMARLFQPFDRLGAEHSSVPGTGLGLVIARDLVHEMGGELAVASVPGAGTTVTLTLPSPAASAAVQH